jgi:hypothetical protein
MVKKQDKSNLLSYIEDNREMLTMIPIEFNKDKDMITNAQNIVKNFIIDRKLIIFGGTAIDYALRLKGSSIYYDYELPDYDILSSDSVNDSYDLSEILYKSGFENVKVIRAIHVGTMRVRVNLISVADIRYIPVKYFSSIKYLEYDQMRILHPDIQRLDLHKSLCFPMNNAPREDIFNRWERDIKRFNLYELYYPIKKNKDNSKLSTKTYTLLDNYRSDLYAFHGFAAFAIYRRELSQYIELRHIPQVEIQFNNNKCELTSPTDVIELVTNEELEWHYHPILNIIPKKHIKDNNVIYYYTELLSINKINDKQVVTIQYLLLYFLFYYIFGNESEKDMYKNYYLYTLELIELSESQYNTELKKSINKNKNKESSSGKVNPFLPGIDFLGKRPEFKMIRTMFPVNYTPSKTGTRQVFDYNLFKLSGEEYV